MLQKNPELLNQANTKMPAQDKSKPDNFPGLTFPLLQTDEPIRSTHDADNGKIMNAYHPVFATGHDHHEPSEHPKAALVTAFDSPTGSTDRAHMPVTHVPNMYSHDFYDIGDDVARQATTIKQMHQLEYHKLHATGKLLMQKRNAAMKVILCNQWMLSV